jgi:hypothetical protein
MFASLENEGASTDEVAERLCDTMRRTIAGKGGLSPRLVQNLGRAGKVLEAHRARRVVDPPEQRVKDNGENVQKQNEQDGDVAELRNRDSYGRDDCAQLLGRSKYSQYSNDAQ